MELCVNCGQESGTSIVCEQCRRGMRSYQREKWDRMFQKRVCELASWCCSYCGGDFDYEEGRTMVCADHLHGKNARPEFRYDLTKARCACGAGLNNCHNERHTGERSPFDPTLSYPSL